MSCLIIYKSKSGYTKRYMEMLLQSVKADIIELKKAKANQIVKYDTLLYAGGIYAGKISGLNTFLKLLGSNIPKKLGIIGVGASPVTKSVKEKLIQSYAEHTYFSGVKGPNADFFYLQSGFDPEKLKPPLKMMLGMVSKSIQKKQIKNPENLTEEDKDFLEFFQKANDQTSESQLKPIIDFLTAID